MYERMAMTTIIMIDFGKFGPILSNKARNLSKSERFGVVISDRLMEEWEVVIIARWRRG